MTCCKPGDKINRVDGDTMRFTNILSSLALKYFNKSLFVSAKWV